MKKKLLSWGNYPNVESEIFSYKEKVEAKKKVKTLTEFIPYGNGRSYGDSCLQKTIVYNKEYNNFLNFNEHKGILKCQSGILLSEILDVFVPKGWFLYVTPGTKFITVGGAIASDVHGKNHHNSGCFSEAIIGFSLLLPDGQIKNCSRIENRELFLMTCGGMGLTGIILDCSLKLKKINSTNIKQTIIKTKNLKETFYFFEEHKNATYSVAWIDCSAKEDQIGRSILTLGEHENDNSFNFSSKQKINIPFYIPSFIINKYTIKIFNFLYYNKVLKDKSITITHINSFFYPLDVIKNWNRIYGKKGFTQYQIVIPLENSYEGLKEILKRISKYGEGSFLAVLKLFGKENENYLSFPMEGYTLAVDFKIKKEIFTFLDELDSIVLKYNGRVYLAKDVRVQKENFEKGYKNIELFRRKRKEMNLTKYINSFQSKRLNI